MSLTNWILLILTAALFGSSFSLVNVAVADIPPIHLAAARIVVAAPVVLVFLYLTGRRLPRLGASWLPLLGLGLLTAAIPYLAIAWGQSHISSSLGGILFATIPLFTVIFAPVFANETKLTGTQFLGVIAAFVGVVLAIGPETLTEVGEKTAGAAVTLAAALSYALGNVYARTLSALDPVLMAAGQLLTASLMLVPLAATAGPSITLEVGLSAILATLAVGIFSTAVPVLLMFTLVKRVGATRTSLLAFFIPIAAVLLGVVLLGERLTPMTLLGFVMIIVGAIWSSRVRPKPADPARSAAGA